MKKIYSLFFVVIAFFSLIKEGWTNSLTEKISHQSELGIVITQGNNSGNTTSLKQETDYKKDEKNNFKLTGHYFYGKSDQKLTARNWNLHLGYERSFNHLFSQFYGAGFEGDKFSGFVLRKNGDAGGKYYFIKKEKITLSNELGYRYQLEKRVPGISPHKLETHFVRDYFQYENKMMDNFFVRLGLEGLYDLKNSKNYRIKGTPSLIFILTDHLSVKLSYEGKYQNLPTIEGNKKYDSLFMSSLVANF